MAVPRRRNTKRLDVVLSATGGAQWPMATYRHPSPESFASAGGSAHWPIRTSPLPLPFHREGVPVEPRDFPCFTALCRVRTEEGNGPRHWPGASQWAPPCRPLPNGGCWAPDVDLQGHFPMTGAVRSPSFPMLQNWSTENNGSIGSPLETGILLNARPKSAHRHPSPYATHHPPHPHGGTETQNAPWGGGT